MDSTNSIDLVTKDNVNILGTEYKIVQCTMNEYDKLHDANGLCESYSKTIYISKDPDDDIEAFSNLTDYKKKVLRHEMIHAFIHESGNESNTAIENELAVDWIACQLPKIIIACLQTGTIPNHVCRKIKYILSHEYDENFNLIESKKERKKYGKQ